MQKYRKLIVAAIGLALLAGKELLGIDLGFGPDQVYTVVVALLTALGVWGAPNEPA